MTASSGNRLTRQSYWDSMNRDYPLQSAGPRDGVRRWLKGLLLSQDIKNGRCFEVGCYPGRYLPLFGEQGFELNGIDLSPQVSDKLPDWLLSQGLRVGNFYCDDFESFHLSDKFDVVFSIGFIEHFRNWQAILAKQASYVSEEGLLIVCVPNFRGIIQRLLHQYLDLDNLKRHNLESMVLRKWIELVGPIGFRLIFSRYFGGFDFWVDKQMRTIIQNKILKRIAMSLPWLRPIMPDSRLYSPYCGLAAKRA